MSRKVTERVRTMDLLRKELQAEMHAKGMSIKDLSELGKIAPKTLGELFDGANERDTVRSDVILRIGRVVQATPEQCQRWLEWAGHPEFSAHKIDLFFREAQTEVAVAEAGPVAAEKYFVDLMQEMKQGWAALMCVCITSKPAPIDDPDLRRTVIEALKSGLHMALACAYPAPSPYYKMKPNLASFYDQIRVWTRKLAGNLRSALEDREKHRVQAFFPIDSSGKHLPLIHPVMQHGEHRPCLVKLLKEGQEKYSLGGYSRRERRWLIVHPRPNASADDQQDAAEICGWWQDYFHDLSAAWQPTDNAQPFAQPLVEWKQWLPDTGSD